MQKIDTSRPYGVVHGLSDYKFEQDNKRFDQNGHEIVKHETKPDKMQDFFERLDIDDSRNECYVTKKTIMGLLEKYGIPYKPVEKKGEMVRKLKQYYTDNHNVDA